MDDGADQIENVLNNSLCWIISQGEEQTWRRYTEEIITILTACIGLLFNNGYVSE